MKPAWPAAAIETSVDPGDTQEGTARERARHQPRDQAGRLPVGVGLPGVQRRESHLRAIADQEEDERGAEQCRAAGWRAPRSGPPAPGGAPRSARRRGRRSPTARARCRPRTAPGTSRPLRAIAGRVGDTPAERAPAWWPPCRPTSAPGDGSAATRVAAARKASRQLTNTRPPRGGSVRRKPIA